MTTHPHERTETKSRFDDETIDRFPVVSGLRWWNPAHLHTHTQRNTPYTAAALADRDHRLFVVVTEDREGRSWVELQTTKNTYIENKTRVKPTIPVGIMERNEMI